MVLFRYPSLHLSVVLLAGLIMAITAVFFPFLLFVGSLLCGLLTFTAVTILCYNPSGKYWRDKLDKLLLLLVVYGNGYYTRYNQPTVPSSIGPLSSLVHFESQKLIRLILRDFMISWYSIVSKDKSMPRDVIKLLQHINLELYVRIQSVDIKELILHILPVINPFLATLNEVGYYSISPNNRSPIYDVNHPFCVILFEKNPRLTHPALKTSATEVQYLQKLIDCFLLSSVPSQYLKCDIAVELIRNILVHRLFIPVFDLLCDPLFLTEAIPLILSKLPDAEVEAILSNMKMENDSLKESLTSDDRLLDSILKEHHSIVRAAPLEECDQPATDEVTAQVVRSVSAPSEELVVVPLPSVYINRHVSVSSKEGVYVGYIIKFPKQLLDDDQLERLELSEETIELESLKRYSEFIKLNKLLLKSDIGYLIKGATLPDKRVISNLWSKVSSSDVDPALVIERKEGLDKYIQTVSNIPEVRQSTYFKDFLESGVSILQEAHIVSNKVSTAGIRKPSTTTASDTLTNQDIESVMDVFMDMQVLLPCCDLLAPNESMGVDRQATSTVLTPPTRATPPTIDWSLQILSDVIFADYNNSTDLQTECRNKAPLFSCIMNLANEATAKTIPELWLTNTTTQLSLINTLGPTIDSYLWKELNEVVNDETKWARMIYNLRRTLWPNNTLREFTKETLTPEQTAILRNAAIAAIKEFLPSLLPILIGHENYDNTIIHCLDTIQNTRINRHFLYHVVDLIFSCVVPEISDTNFHQRVLDWRSKPLFVSK